VCPPSTPLPGIYSGSWWPSGVFELPAYVSRGSYPFLKNGESRAEIHGCKPGSCGSPTIAAWMNATTGERLSSPSSRVACFVEDLPPFDDLPGPIRCQRNWQSSRKSSTIFSRRGDQAAYHRLDALERTVALCRHWGDAQHPLCYHKKPALCMRNLEETESEMCMASDHF
jgi:hypothetical protein